MNATIRRANEIRRQAAVKFGGRPGDYSLKIACEMAKNGEKVMNSKIIRAKSERGQDFEFEVAEGKIVAATVISPTRGPLLIDGHCLSGSMLDGKVAGEDGNSIRICVGFRAATVKEIRATIECSRPAEPAVAEKVPGLSALRKARNTRSYEHEMLMRAIDSGSSRCPAQTVTDEQAKALEAQYPAAVAYLRAESYKAASNVDKYSAGRKAMELLLSGGSVEQANEIMDNWLPAFCD